MRYYLLSDNIDTKIGMRLAGVDGELVHSADEFRKAFDGALSASDIAVLLITQKLASLNQSYIKEQKTNNRLPLIVEIPDRHGSARPNDYILNYVKDAVGIKEV